MISIASKLFTRALTLVLPALMLAGCFGNGEGPDPIAGTPAPPPPDIPPGFCDPINFEDLCGPFIFTEFEGGPVTIIDNPDVGALNDTDKVARMQKFAAESGLTFGGSTLALPGGMDFTNGEAFTMLVWASRQVPVLFKFEGLGQERIVDHSGNGMWEELCFDFTGTTAGPAATGISFIFDVNVLGDAANPRVGNLAQGLVQQPRRRIVGVVGDVDQAWRASDRCPQSCARRPAAGRRCFGSYQARVGCERAEAGHRR